MQKSDKKNETPETLSVAVNQTSSLPSVGLETSYNMDPAGLDSLRIYPGMRWTADIYDFDLSKFCESKETCDKIKQCLAEYWNNRTLIEIKKNQFILVWSYSQTYPWSTLSSDEQKLLEKIFEKNDIAQNKLWKKRDKNKNL